MAPLSLNLMDQTAENDVCADSVLLYEKGELHLPEEKSRRCFLSLLLTALSLDQQPSVQMKFQVTIPQIQGFYYFVVRGSPFSFPSHQIFTLPLTAINSKLHKQEVQEKFVGVPWIPDSMSPHKTVKVGGRTQLQSCSRCCGFSQCCQSSAQMTRQQNTGIEVTSTSTQHSHEPLLEIET